MMYTYEYTCDDCGGTMLTGFRGDRYTGTCPHCHSDGPHRRRYSIHVHRPMQEHWNRTTGQPVSSMKQFGEQLKIKSHEQTLRTGVEAKYVPLDMSDREACGVTNVDEIREQQQAKAAGSADAAAAAAAATAVDASTSTTTPAPAGSNPAYASAF